MDTTNITKNLQVWAGAYKNINRLNREISLLDEQKYRLLEEVNSEKYIANQAKMELDAILDTVPPEEEQKIIALYKEHLGDVLIESIIRPTTTLDSIQTPTVQTAQIPIQQEQSTEECSEVQNNEVQQTTEQYVTTPYPMVLEETIPTMVRPVYNWDYSPNNPMEGDSEECDPTKGFIRGEGTE